MMVCLTRSIAVSRDWRFAALSQTTPQTSQNSEPRGVTDEEVEVRTVLPNGWVFYEAQVASGTAKGTGDIKFDYSQRHSSLATFAFNNNGMAHSYEEAKELYGLDAMR